MLGMRLEEGVGGRGVRLVSAVPGRIRLRADASAPVDLPGLGDELRAWPAISAVDVRPRSASIVVHFPPDQATAVADGLLALGVELRAGTVPDVARPATTVVAAAATAGNAAVARRLGGTDLRVLIPVGLGLMAARRAMRGSQRLADAPWYVLAWYASETFFRFHGDAARAAGQPTDSEET